MKTLAVCVGLILGASWAFGGAGGRSITLDINQQDRAFSNTVARGEAFDWEIYITRGGAAYTNETITGGGIYYSTSRTASAWVVFPFSSWSATGGRVVCRMAATNSMGLSTNSADYPIPYDASIILTTSNNVYRWRQGILTITDDGAISGSTAAAVASGMVPSTRTLTINGVSYDLSSDRSWTVTAAAPSNTAWSTVTGTPTTVSGYGITDAATAAQGIAATNAQARVAVVETNTVTLAMTNGWETGSHTGLVTRSDTNGWVVSAHSSFVTNDQFGVRFGIVTSDTFQAQSSAGWALKANNGSTCISGGAGGGCNVTLSDGTTINGLLTANGGITSTGAVNVLGGGNVVTNGQKIAASTNADYSITSGTASNLVGAQSNTLATALQPVSTQGLATVTYVDTATNAAVIDATQRVSTVGYLLPVSTQGLAAVAQLADYAPTNTIYYYAAPACYQVTLTNDSPLSYTNNWSPTSAVSRVTALGTGTVTFVMNWPANQVAYWGFCYDATGMPSTVFPAGAIYFTNGVFSATAPTLGKSNYVSMMRSCATFQIMAFTNTLGTWGTP